jgi:hypothetical protein
MKKISVNDAIIFFLLVAVGILGMKIISNDRKIEHLRKGVVFLYKAAFYEAGTAEPIWDSKSKKFILKGEVLPNEPTSDRCNEREPEE